MNARGGPQPGPPRSPAAHGLLGVGTVWWPELAPLLDAAPALVSVLELEPQAFWEARRRNGRWHYRANQEAFEAVAAAGRPVLLHGVGHPLANLHDDPVDPWPMWRDAVARLDPVWVSEHLSYNRTLRPDTWHGNEHAGFLLPPPQWPATVGLAARRLAELRAHSGRPVAFETGVHYLRPRADEMADGAFFTAVAEAADAGILLDLHNLWCNELNGRCPMDEVLAALPLQRVVELHVAGGMACEGRWLDAHSGPVPPALMDRLAALLPRLTGLRALVFEILPGHLPALGLDGVARQLEQLQRLWADALPHRCLPVARWPDGSAARPLPADDPVARTALHRRMQALADRLRGRTSESDRLDDDPGVPLLRGLVQDFRRANLARTLRYTMTLLLCSCGPQEVEALLQAWFRQRAPDPFAALEAAGFADFLLEQSGLLTRVAWLDQVLGFERALIRATVYGEESLVKWRVDPVRLLEALDQGAAPHGLPDCPSRLRIEAVAEPDD